MDKNKVIERLEKLKHDILADKIAEPYGAVAITKSEDEFPFSKITDDKFINQLMEDKRFRAQALRTGEFSGDYWVRINCNPDLPGLSSDCKLTAEIDVEKDIEDMELEVLQTVERNEERNLCEGSRYPNLCKRAVIAIPDQHTKQIIQAFRNGIRNELEDYFDFVEFRKGTRSLEEF